MNAIMNVQIDENKVKEEVMSKIINDIRRETKFLEDEAVETRREIKRNLMDEIKVYVEKKIDLHMESLSEKYIEDRIDSVIEDRIEKETTMLIRGFYDFKDKLFNEAEERKRLGMREYSTREDAFHTGVECAYLVFNNIINPDDEESKKKIYDHVIFEVAYLLSGRIRLNENTRKKMAESIVDALAKRQEETEDGI